MCMQTKDCCRACPHLNEVGKLGIPICDELVHLVLQGVLFLVIHGDVVLCQPRLSRPVLQGVKRFLTKRGITQTHHWQCDVDGLQLVFHFDKLLHGMISLGLVNVLLCTKWAHGAALTRRCRSVPETPQSRHDRGQRVWSARQFWLTSATAGHAQCHLRHSKPGSACVHVHGSSAVAEESTRTAAVTQAMLRPIKRPDMLSYNYLEEEKANHGFCP